MPLPKSCHLNFFSPIGTLTLSEWCSLARSRAYLNSRRGLSAQSLSCNVAGVNVGAHCSQSSNGQCFLESVRCIVHAETLLHEMSCAERMGLSSPILPVGKQTAWKRAETTRWDAFVGTSYYSPCQTILQQSQKNSRHDCLFWQRQLFQLSPFLDIQRHVSALCLGIHGQILMGIGDTNLKWDLQEKVLPGIDSGEGFLQAESLSLRDF